MALTEITPSTATSSGHYGSDTPAKIIDGDVATYLNWGGSGAGHTATLDLGSDQTVAGVQVYLGSFNNSPRAYTIAYAADVEGSPGSWTDEVEYAPTDDYFGAVNYHVFDTPVTARFVRIEVDAGNGGEWMILHEFKAYSDMTGLYPVAEVWRGVSTAQYQDGTLVDAAVILDEDDDTRTQSKIAGGFSSSDCYALVDYGESVPVSAVSIKQSGAESLVVEYSDSRFDSYTTAHTEADSTGDEGSLVEYTFTEQEARYWRVRPTSGAEWTQWWTVEFNGEYSSGGSSKLGGLGKTVTKGAALRTGAS